MAFWLYTTRYEYPGTVTLHRDGCSQRRIINRNPRWTGPLSWDDIALIPVESYAPCRACMACRETLHIAPPYGPRRHKSRGNQPLAQDMHP